MFEELKNIGIVKSCPFSIAQSSNVEVIVGTAVPPPPPPPTKKELQTIEDGCKVDAIIVGENKKATLTINIERLQNQKSWIGKKVGDVLKTTSATLSYRVERIYKE